VADRALVGSFTVLMDVLVDAGAARAGPDVRAGLVLRPRARTPAATRDLVEGIRAL
jgi:hypothetical protein